MGEQNMKNIFGMLISAALFLLAFGVWMTINKAIKQVKSNQLESLNTLDKAKMMSGILWFAPLILGVVGYIMMMGKMYKIKSEEEYPKRRFRKQTFICDDE